jgi:hypothetical protein
MFRKATLAAIALIAMAGVLTGCAPVAYTGTGIVKSHRQSGKNCMATLETPNHGTAEFNMGLRGTCSGLTDGATVTMENGFYKR